MVATENLKVYHQGHGTRANQVGYIISVIARVARDLWRRKQTLSSGFALGLGSFTAINPWPHAIAIILY